MANQHMITAASNLEKALSDINQYRNEIQRDLDDSKRSCTERLKQIDEQIVGLRATIAKTKSDAMRSSCNNQIRHLEQERNQIDQAFSEQERYALQQFHFAEQNTSEIRGFIGRLQTMA